MRIKLIGFTGLILIASLLAYLIYEHTNMGPYFMGDTKQEVGYVTNNEIVPNGRNVTHRIAFKYQIEGKWLTDYYYSNGRISKLTSGDSVLLEVSIGNPSKCKLTSFYPHR